MPLLILTGFMATGKSAVGPRAAKQLGYSVLDLDREIERVTGRSIPQIFAEQGEDGFREIETARLKSACEGDNCVIITGGGAVIREANRRTMAASGHVVCLWASATAIVRRTRRGKTGRPLLDGVDDPMAHVSRMLKERERYYRECHHIVDTTGRTVEAVSAEVVRLHREGEWKRSGLR